MALGVIDEVVSEPPGGAQRKPQVAAQALRAVIARHLAELRSLDAEGLVAQRYQRFRTLGTWH
jgi:acetyl-CoA carboxylase alpha subunit